MYQIPNYTSNPLRCPLNLRQVSNWDPPKEVYINGIKWTLRKDYRDSSGSIPNITSICFDDINSGYMKIDEMSNQKVTVYMFLYYGTIMPRPGSYEKPMNVFFQWFNDKPVQLRKDMISEVDWNRANVYISEYGSLQNATKNALFKVVEEKSNVTKVEPLPDIDINTDTETLKSEINEVKENKEISQISNISINSNINNIN